MRHRLTGIAAGLQLARVGLVFTAVADIWLVALLSRALGGPATDEIRDLPIWGVLISTGFVAIGMYVFGMALNDVMDVRRDRTFAPDRPIPAGLLSPVAGMAVAVGALLLAIAGSMPLGTLSTGVCVGCAVLILFYNAVAKHLGSVGVVTLAFIRAAHMLIANPLLAFCWPVWLTMTHVLGISTLCHRLEDKRPTLTTGHLWTVTGCWAFASVAMLTWMSRRGGLEAAGMGWIWIGPTVAALVFIAWAWIKVRQEDDARRAGGKVMKRGLLWLIVYDAMWLGSAGLWRETLLIALLLPGALVTMSLMRQLKIFAAEKATIDHR